MRNCINCSRMDFSRGPVKGSSIWGEISMQTCQHCGLAQLQEWNAGFQPHLYDYYASWTESQIQEAYSSLNAERHSETLEELAQLVSGRRLLDVGCGTGHFVESACRLGWDAQGVDLAEGAVMLAQARGIPCSNTDFFDISPDDERYDVVFMSEFIEHVPSPGVFLSHAEKLLRNGGILYLTTPNLNALTRRVSGTHWPVFHPEHLCYFSPESLRSTIRSQCPSLSITNFEAKNFSLAPLASRLRARLGTRRSNGLRKEPSDQLQDVSTVDQSVRLAVNASQWLSRAKKLANIALSSCGAGDTLVVTLRKS